MEHCQVLDLMVRMLGFSEEDKQRIGFAQQVAGKGIVRGVLGLPGRLVGGMLGGGSPDISAAHVPSENQVHFLIFSNEFDDYIFIVAFPLMKVSILFYGMLISIACCSTSSSCLLSPLRIYGWTFFSKKLKKERRRKLQKPLGHLGEPQRRLQDLQTRYQLLRKGQAVLVSLPITKM